MVVKRRLLSVLFGVGSLVALLGLAHCAVPGVAGSVRLPDVTDSRAVVEHTFFGVENVPWQKLDIVHDSLPVIAELGVGLVGRNSLDWGHVEPRPPQGGQRQFDFTRLDQEFQLYRDHGLQVQVVLRSRSSWATVVPAERLPAAAGSPPKPEYWGLWETFVEALVERYGDVLRIISVQGEVEFPNHWQKHGGTPENYHRLLQLTMRGARRANPAVKIARAGTSAGPLFDNDPPLSRVRQRIQQSPRVRNMYDSIAYSLARPEDYDYFGIHVNRSYTGLEPFVRFIRQEMRQRGYSKSILIEDSSTVYAGRMAEIERLSQGAEVKNILDLYSAIERRRSLDESLKQALHAHQAAHTIKKATVALAAGVEVILFTGYLDSPTSPFVQIRYGGLIDTEVYQGTRDVRRSLKPAYYALKDFVRRVVGGPRQVERVAGTAPGTYLYRFGMPDGRSFYIGWAEEGEVSVRIPWKASKAKVTPIVTTWGKAQEVPRMLDAQDGSLTVELTRVPGYIEFVEASR